MSHWRRLAFLVGLVLGNIWGSLATFHTFKTKLIERGLLPKEKQ